MFFSTRIWEWALENPVHAGFVISILEDKGIPYQLIPHGESSWGNAIEVVEGYGHLEIPPEYQDEMREIWQDLNQKSQTSD